MENPEQQKQQLENDIAIKQEELKKFKSDILSEQEKKEKADLEKDVAKLQTQLDTLKLHVDTGEKEPLKMFWKDKFVEVFDIIKKPFDVLGIPLLPSDIVGTGMLGAALDKEYLSAEAAKKVIPAEEPSFMTETSLEKSKKLTDLNFGEAKALAATVFGRGPATELLIRMSNNDPAMIVRVIALGKHEGGLAFGRKNEDPNKESGQINIGTFQLSAQKDEIVDKYNNSLSAGKKLLRKNHISFDDDEFKKIKNYTDSTGSSDVEKAQCDLLSWLGYLSTQKSQYIDALADSSLTTAEVQELMPRIQGGISAIGTGVAKQLEGNSVSDYTSLSNLA